MEHELAILMDFDIGQLEPATPTSTDNIEVQDVNTMITSNINKDYKLEELLGTNNGIDADNVDSDDDG